VTAVARSPRKQDAALGLKLAGATLTEIATALNFKDEAAVRQAIDRAAAANVVDDDRVKHRQLANLRYERLLRAAMVMALDGSKNNHQQLPAIRAAREIVDRIVALNGAAMPVEVIVSSPAEAELRAWVAKVAQIEMPEVIEHDIFEAEVVSDEPNDGESAE
jgi:hypothetical protein